MGWEVEECNLSKKGSKLSICTFITIQTIFTGYMNFSKVIYILLKQNYFPCQLDFSVYSTGVELFQICCSFCPVMLNNYSIIDSKC